VNFYSFVDDNEESELFLKNLRHVEKAFDRVVTIWNAVDSNNFYYFELI